MAHLLYARHSVEHFICIHFSHYLCEVNSIMVSVLQMT